MQSVSSKIWTRVAVSISYDDNDYTTGTSSFFQAAIESVYGCTTWTLTNMTGEKAWRQLHKNAASHTEQVLEATPHKAAALRPPTSHHENYQS